MGLTPKLHKILLYFEESLQLKFALVIDTTGAKWNIYLKANPFKLVLLTYTVNT